MYTYIFAFMCIRAPKKASVSERIVYRYGYRYMYTYMYLCIFIYISVGALIYKGPYIYKGSDKGFYLDTPCSL